MPQTDFAEGRVVIVTGAGRGLGKAHALEFARHGARVLVNDLGVTREGESPQETSASTPAETPAAEVVSEIRAAGGEAEVNYADVADWEQARQMVAQAIEQWGRRRGSSTPPQVPG